MRLVGKSSAVRLDKPDCRLADPHLENMNAANSVPRSSGSPDPAAATHAGAGLPATRFAGPSRQNHFETMTRQSAVRPASWLAASLCLALLGCRSGDTAAVSRHPSASATNAVSTPAADTSAPPVVTTGLVGLNSTDQPAAPLISTNAPTARIEPAMPQLTGPVHEVLDMAQAQVGESVLLEFVRNSKVPFDLDAEDLVYLKDMGVPDAVVSAMLKRNAELAEQGIAAVAATTEDSPVVETAPATTEAAPPSAAAQGAAPEQNVYSQTVTPDPGTAAPAAVVGTAPVPASQNYFYSALSPYGSWLYIEPHGWCWQPTCAVTVVDWRPYSHGGRWLYTTSGWYWQSSYSWGWAPFHYGNWYVSPACGWVWVPGHVWAPAWVTWRYTPAYCGWAPLPPGCGWSTGIGLTYCGSGVSTGFSFGLSSSWYTFVGWDRCWDPHPYRHRLPPRHATTVYHNSTVINNYYVDNSSKTVVNNGVPREHLPTGARREMRRLDIKDVHAGSPTPVRPEQTSLDRSKVAAYRPTVPPDLKAGPKKPADVPYRTPSRQSADGTPRRSAMGTAPTDLGPSPSRSFTTAPRSLDGGMRTYPNRGGISSTPTPGRSGAAATSTGPTRTGGPASPTSAPSRVDPVRRDTAPGSTPPPVDTRRDASPSRRPIATPGSVPSTSTRIDRPTSPSSVTPGSVPRTSSGQAPSSIGTRSRVDVPSPAVQPSPSRRIEPNRATVPSAPATRSVTPSAPSTRSIGPTPPTQVPRSYTPPAPNRSVGPGVSTPVPRASTPVPNLGTPGANRSISPAAPMAPSSRSSVQPSIPAPSSVAPAPRVAPAPAPSPSRSPSTPAPQPGSTPVAPGSTPSRAAQPR